MQATDKVRQPSAETVKGKILINRKRLLAMIPLSDRTIYNMELRGEFPHRITLTSRNVAWDLTEVEQWVETRKSSGELARRPGSVGCDENSTRCNLGGD